MPKPTVSHHALRANVVSIINETCVVSSGVEVILCVEIFMAMAIYNSSSACSLLG
jgi:hypothetical protein